MAEQIIDELFDGPELLAQQRAAVALVEDFIDRVEEARKLHIDLNINTKTLADYNKKIDALQKQLNGIQTASDKATKSTTLLAKQQEAAAKAALAQTRAEAAATKEAERLAVAQKKATAAANEAERPYKRLALAFTAAAREAQDLAAQYGSFDKRAQAAAKRANELNDRLKEIDSSVGINNRRVGSYSEALDNFSGKLKNVAAGFLAILGVGSVFKDSIDEFIQMDKNVRILQNTLKNRGVPEAFERIEKSAKSLAQQFTFLDDDDILKTFNQLTVYGKLTEEQMNELIPVIIDFATATGQDLGGATSTIIKALEGNGKALKEYGINIKDAKSTTEAFSIIMTQLKPKVEGVGQAFGESAAGGLASASQEFKNLKEDLGRDLLPALNVLLSVLLKIANVLGDAAKAAFALGGALRDAATSGKTVEFSIRERLGFTDDDQFEIQSRQNIIIGIVKDGQNKLIKLQEQGAKKEFTIEQVKDELLANLQKQSDKRLAEAQKSRNAELIRDALNDQEALKRARGQLSGLNGPITPTDDPNTPFNPEKIKERADNTRQIEFETLKARLEMYKENDLALVENDKLTYDERIAALIRYGNDSQKLIIAQANFQLNAEKLTAAEIVKIEQDRNDALFRLMVELSKKNSELIKKDLDANAGGLADTVKGIQDSIAKAGAATKKATEEAGKNLLSLRKQMKDALVSLSTELQGLFFDIFQNALEKQKNAIQDQIDLLEAQKQKDIELANQTIANADRRADEIAVIEARAAAKRQQLELRQRQIDQQKAKFDKAAAVAGIIQATSLAVAGALAQVKTLGPGAIALAAVIGALGAIQLTRTLAQPIPRYAEGTDYHPGGMAVVGDGGRHEGVILPDGTVYKTPATDTLVNLPKGSQVIKDYATMTKPPSFSVQTIDTREELRAGFGAVVQAVKRIPQPIIRADRAWTQAHKQGSSFRNYLNRNI